MIPQLFFDLYLLYQFDLIMEVSLYLKRPDATGETSIFARISYDGRKLKYYLPEKINPKLWNKATQRAKESSKFREYPEFNQRLSNIEADIKNVFRKYLNDNDGAFPAEEAFKELIDKKIKNAVDEKKVDQTFFGFFTHLIEQTKTGTRLNPKTGKPYSKNTVKAYVTTFKNLTEYNKLQKRKIDFKSFDLDFYASYMEYLIKTHKFTTNTVGKHIKILKVILNEATERGLNKSLAYKSKRFITVKENTDNIYLDDKEMLEIEKLDLTGNAKLEKVRDLFLIGCYTGLRYSDYSVLKPVHFRDGFIHIDQFKTKDPVVIPIHTTVQRIIDKYHGILPKSITNQKTNDYLKEMGKLVPGMDLQVTKTVTKGGLSVTTNYSKWELITTHTARRSFATNEYLAGTPAITIMKITGHRTEKSFLGYIKLTPNEHAKLMKMHWDKRAAGLKAV